MLNCNAEMQTGFQKQYVFDVIFENDQFKFCFWKIFWALISLQVESRTTIIWLTLEVSKQSDL